MIAASVAIIGRIRDRGNSEYKELALICLVEEIKGASKTPFTEAFSAFMP
jgi:hypothetical protein